MGEFHGCERKTVRQIAHPRDLNKALLREHYQLPTQEEITSRLAGAKYFSKLDATSGFWQMPLDEESFIIIIIIIIIIKELNCNQKVKLHKF